MKPTRTHKLTLASLIFLALLACNATFSAEFPTPTPTELAMVLPTSTAYVQELKLISEPYEEKNETPPFTITAQIPQLTGSNDPRVQALNQQLKGLVMKQVDAFRQSFLQNTAPTVSNGSTLDVTYTLVSQRNDLWSFQFRFSFYSDGAAHPGQNNMTLNYDLARGKELSLADLFLANSNYLEVISNYCITQLSKQPFFDSTSVAGAQPTLENYRNWNIHPDGLLITFDEYQVAPYAAGPQTVTMPYSELQAIIDPQGPLAGSVR